MGRSACTAAWAKGDTHRVVKGPDRSQSVGPFVRPPERATAGLTPGGGANLRLVEDFVERVVLRLREEPGFSRNRHFLAFSSQEGRRALRIHRHLRSIERDLSRGSSATVDLSLSADRVCLTLRSKSGLRPSWLTRAEFRILRPSLLVRSSLDVAS